MFVKSSVGIILLLALAWGAVFLVNPDVRNLKDTVIISSITNFEECFKFGGHILDTHPRQCNSEDGRSYVEVITPLEGITNSGCARAGCSNQLCVDEKTASDISTTCEYKESYACYRSATCERQSNGQCGFTPSFELKACLNVN